MNNIWFTSDLHFNHENIIEYCNRPFYDVFEMNETLIRNYNSLVKPDDEVFILGDLCMGLPFQWSSIVSRLNGRKTLVLGNHDNEKYYKTMPSIEYIIKKAEVLLFEGLCILLCHYPYNEDYRCVKNLPSLDFDFSLCGHIHEKWRTNIIDGKFAFNVGVDVNDFRPVSLEEIIKEYQNANNIY